MKYFTNQYLFINYSHRNDFGEQQTTGLRKHASHSSILVLKQLDEFVGIKSCSSTYVLHYQHCHRVVTKFKRLVKNRQNHVCEAIEVKLRLRKNEI